MSPPLAIPLPAESPALSEARLCEELTEVSGPMMAVALRLLGSEADARDVLQEAWLRAWRHRSKLEKLESIRPWIRAVVVRECYRALQRRRALRWLGFSSEVPDLPDPRPRLDDALGDGERLWSIERAVDRLPARQKVVWKLRFGEGWTIGQIAQSLDLSPETVKTHLGRALESVRAEVSHAV